MVQRKVMEAKRMRTIPFNKKLSLSQCPRDLFKLFIRHSHELYAFQIYLQVSISISLRHFIKDCSLVFFSSQILWIIVMSHDPAPMGFGSDRSSDILPRSFWICPSVTVSHTGPEAARHIFISNYHFSFFL